MRVKAISVATVCSATALSIPSQPSGARAATRPTDSPTQPSPMLAIVMPSCVAAIASSRRSMASEAACAPRRPSATQTWIWLRRTATSANSVATK